MEKYKHIALKVSKILGIIVGVGAFLFVALALVLTTHTAQQKVKEMALEVLQDNLDTDIELDDLHLNPWTNHIHIYGLKVDDQQGKLMLELDTLDTCLSLWGALTRNIRIKSAKLCGVKADLHQVHPDSVANYQFILDAFKGDASKKKQVKGKKGPKKPMDLDVRDLEVRNVELRLEKPKKGLQNVVDVKLQSLSLEGKKKQLLSVRGLQLKNDNGLPRKNEGRPNRGAFDATHVDIYMDLDLRIQHHGLDSATVEGLQVKGADRASGLILDSLTFVAQAGKKQAHISKMMVKTPHVKLHLNDIDLNYGTKGQFLYHAAHIAGDAVITDIAQPFAPVLADFTTPVKLELWADGDTNDLRFHDIHVFTADQRLGIWANGGVYSLSSKGETTVDFVVDSMYARKGIKEQIISHFKVKETMLGMVESAGDITFKGHLNIPPQQVKLDGTVGTAVGKLNFGFVIESDGYMNGEVHTKGIQVGKVIDYPELGKVKLDALFSFDTTGSKKAQELGRKFGKLPVGYLKGTVPEADHKYLTLKNLDFNITSDGDAAQGKIQVRGGRVDLKVDFTFTDTRFKHSLKCKPSISFHKLSKEAKQEREARKAQKKAEKARKES